MNNKFYTSRYDRLFKKIFFKEEDHDLLEELIKEITNLVICVEKIVNCELPITDIFEKAKRVDGIIDTTKERIHIEINSDTKDYYRMRNFLYFVSIMLEDIKRGKNYNPKKKYIHISLDFSDKNNLQNITKYRCYDVINKVATVKNITLYYVNVNRIKRICKENKNLQKEYALLYALDLGKEELVDFAERTNNKMVKKYKDEITKLNDDTIVIKSLTYEEDREMLMNAIKEDYLEEGRELGVKEGHKLGIKEGHELGIKEGQNQNKLETAKKLLEMNMSLDDIVNVTGLKKKNVIEIKSCMI